MKRVVERLRAAPILTIKSLAAVETTHFVIEALRLPDNASVELLD